MKSGISLLLSDSRGVYIPRDFVRNFDSTAWHFEPKYTELLSHPANGGYWDTWGVVLNNAYFIDESGNKWTLWQDGGLWAICFELMTDGQKQNFGFRV